MNKPEKLEIGKPAEGSPEEIAERGDELSLSEDSAATVYVQLSRACKLLGLVSREVGGQVQGLFPRERVFLLNEALDDVQNAFHTIEQEDERRIRIANREAYGTESPQVAVD